MVAQQQTSAQKFREAIRLLDVVNKKNGQQKGIIERQDGTIKGLRDGIHQVREEKTQLAGALKIQNDANASLIELLRRTEGKIIADERQNRVRPWLEKIRDGKMAASEALTELTNLEEVVDILQQTLEESEKRETG